MNYKINYLLAMLVVLLVLVGTVSIVRPLRFRQEVEARELVVKQRLLTIRNAEEAYRRANGAYTTRLEQLVDSGFMPDSARYIPYTDHQTFTVLTATHTSSTGHQTPLMECGVTYQTFLRGLNRREVRNMAASADMSGRFAGLKIGDLKAPNNNAGNWE